jgi:hypothetical protein
MSTFVADLAMTLGTWFATSYEPEEILLTSGTLRLSNCYFLQFLDFSLQFLNATKVTVSNFLVAINYRQDL